MKSIQAFFGDIKNTFYNPAFYASITGKNTGAAVLFLLGVTALSALALTVYFSIIAASWASSFSPSEFVSEHYPTDLVVNIKDGKASSNQIEPYFIPLEEEMRDKEGAYENILVIDTRPDVTLETLNSYKAFVVLTQDRAFLASDEREGRVVPLDSTEDFVMDKTIAESLLATLISVLWVAIVPLALLAIVIIAMFSLVFHLIASLVGALLVLAAGMVRKTKLDYQDAYKIALFASVPVIVVQTIATFFGIPALPYFLDAFLFIIIVFANLTPKVGTAHLT